jgi:four helix bundle protein
MTGGYIKLGDLKVYQLAIKLGEESWKVYETFDWHDQKIIGDQFITAVDSIGANIAEGYGRFHYLDRIKFYYNARASLFETKHWLLILQRRNKISVEIFNQLLKQSEEIHKVLNVFISVFYQSKK